MIKVSMLGGARKAFGVENMDIDREEITIANLLNVLDGLKNKDADGIEPKNTLVAINGVEISAVGGMNAIVRDGDMVSIIPVVHGGSGKLRKITMDIDGVHLEGYWINRMSDDSGAYIDNIRTKFPKLSIQAITSECVIGKEHVKRIVGISLQARKKGILLAKKLEMDILLRFAGTTQISQAINLVGAKPDCGFVLLVIGSALQCKKLYNNIDRVDLGCVLPTQTSLTKLFNISKKEKDASGGMLEDILAERAAVLV